MEHAVDRLSPPLRRLVAYHLGWSDAEGHAQGDAGGKALRPTLALLAAEAVGASASAAVRGAVAIELVHNFSLLHDDVMDGDTERRHRPTVWARFGLGQAIVAGDALLALAHELVLDDARPVALRAASELNTAIAEMIQGQAEDLSFEARVDVTGQECLAMSNRKTAALFASTTAVGAILGGADEVSVRALRSFGRELGMAYQAVDDVLGIWGEPAVTGKPAANDLRQRKKSLPIVHVLDQGGRSGGELSELLSKPDIDEHDLTRAVAVLDAAGSQEWTMTLAERHFRNALSSLEQGRLRPDAVKDLREVAGFATSRDF